MKQACVIGWPIAHSRSPMIHGYWLKRYGIDGAYTKEAVPPEDVAEFLATLGERGLAGCNVTVPHKGAAFAAADVKAASAQAVAAANTLWLEDGKLHAANTDTYGFMRNLELAAPDRSVAHKPVTILGAGGAARAIVFGFLEGGASEVRVCNRTRARAEALAEQFGARIKVVEWDARNRAARDSAVLVNTTTIGMDGQGSPDIDFAGFDPGCVVCDIVYVPLQTELLGAARAHGLRAVDGLGMLLHQAVPGFEKWFGVRPEVTAELRDLVVADITRGSC